MQCKSGHSCVFSAARNPAASHHPWDAGESANLHLYQGSLDSGFLEQEDIIGAVVEHFHAESGCLEHIGVSGFHCLWKSRFYVRITELLTGIWKRGEKEKKEKRERERERREGGKEEREEEREDVGREEERRK